MDGSRENPSVASENIVKIHGQNVLLRDLLFRFFFILFSSTFYQFLCSLMFISPHSLAGWATIFFLSFFHVRISFSLHKMNSMTNTVHGNYTMNDHVSIVPQRAHLNKSSC